MSDGSEEFQLKAIYSADAEAACIGAVIINPGSIDEMGLIPDDFHVITNGYIWDALLKISGRKEVIDFVTLVNELEDRGRLAEVGGPAGLSKFTSFTPSSMHGESYAAVVKRLARRRRILLEAQKLAQAVYDPAVDEDKLTDVVTTAFDKMCAGSSGAGVKHISFYADRVFEEVFERMENPNRVWGLATGMRNLDEFTGGLHSGQVFDVAGEPGVGKSKFVGNVVVGLAKNKHAGLILSLEMDGVELLYRYISAEGRISTRKLLTGEMDDADVPVFTNAVGVTSSLPIYIYQDDLDITNLRSIVSEYKRKYNIEWVLIDYLSLMSGYEKLDYTQRMAALSRQVKGIAKTYGVAVVRVNAVTKEGMQGADPSMKDMQGSGSVIHDAHLIAFVTVDKVSGLMHLKFVKTRSISGGTNRVLEFYLQAGYPAVDQVVTKKVDLSRLPIKQELPVD